MPKSPVQMTLKGLAIAFLLEATVLYFATGAAIWALISGDAVDLVITLALAVLALGAGLWLTSAARAITKGKRWARSAGVFWQLIQLTCLGAFQPSVPVAIAIILISAGVLITLFSKPVVEATSI